jgi:hypothetical protein
MDSARELTARLEGLSSVALRSGADAPAIALLLEAASVATMSAVALDLLCGPALNVPAAALVTERPTLVRTRLLDAA